MRIDYDVAVVGLGHVGLPLAKVLREKGLRVVGVDILDKDQIAARNQYLKKLVLESDIDFTHLMNVKDEIYCKNWIVCPGVNLDQNRNLDPEGLWYALNFLPTMPFLNVMLRSTVDLKTFKEFEKRLRKKVAPTVSLSYCPERIIEGEAEKELLELPQIIGVSDDISFQQASEVFQHLGVETLKATVEEAVLSKIMTNVYRYVEFAIPNYFMRIALQNGVDYHQLANLMKYKYPRLNNIKSPGLTGGPCLAKDWALLDDCGHGLAYEAFLENSMLFQTIVQKTMPSKGNICILGVTMKKDSKNTTGSVALELHKEVLRRALPSQRVYVYDPNVGEDNIDVVKNSDFVYIAMNHSWKEEVLEALEGKDVVDIWNVLELDQLVIGNVGGIDWQDVDHRR
jgi:UDP-N-acetyl-D-mannosaminuronic acid dehydrogenase